MINQAFVLAAGLGTRLRPLTDELPKPLIPIFQKPLITFALDHLIDAGVSRFVMNTHRLPETFSAVFPERSYRAKPIQFTHEPTILGTGGGIKNAEGALSHEPFFVYSGDVLTDLDLSRLRDEHLRAGNLVTLALRQTSFPPTVAVAEGRVTDIGRKFGQAGQYDFANVSIWNWEMLARMPGGQELSFVPVLLDAIGKGHRIGGVVSDGGQWFNIGSAKEYLRVHRFIRAQSWRPAYVDDPAWPVAVHPTANVSPSAELLGCSSVGPGCQVGPEAILEDSIAWQGSQIAPRSRLNGCIVRARRTTSGTLSEAII
ncbi:MAG: NDP-sugar synthase [Verrucomicrobiota bacterium]